MLVSTLLLSLLPTGDVHEDRVRGFRIEVPDGWQRVEQDAGPQGFVLRLAPPGSQGAEGVTVTVLTLSAGEGADDLLRRARERVEADTATYSGFEEWEGTLGERALRGVRVDYAAPTGAYHIEQRFLVEGARAYLLQRHAPRDEFARRADELEAVLQTFAPLEPTGADEAGQRLRALAERCGSEVSWAASWGEAAERARSEERPILVVAHLLSSFALGETPRNTTFMDEDVIALVEERFVPLWYTKGMPSPLDASYGLGPFAFGEALLVASPDGEVLFENRNASSPDVAHAFLRAALAALPRSPDALPADLPAVERAERHADRGELDRALAVLEGEDSGRAHRLRARVLRLQRRGPEALEALGAARAAGGEPEAGLDLEEAALRARERELERAVALTERVLATEDPELSAPALVQRGFLHLAAGETEAARERWRRVVDDHADTRWAWSAAALLGSPTLDAGVRIDPGWADEDLLAEKLLFREPAPADAGNDPGAALAWLLAAQRADGTWVSPMQSSLPDLGPDPFVDAVTALGATALLRHRDVDGAFAAAERALGFLLGSIAHRREVPPRVFFMDYTTWSDSMMLAFLADALEAGLGERETLIDAAAAVMADLAERQRDNGGWSYYVTTDLAGDAAPSQSISFTTAAAVRALARAREVGLELPEGLLEDGVAALLDMRGEDGVFAYFLYGEGPSARRSTDAPGSVGRGPACELALLRAGESDEQRVRAALDAFLEHAPLYTAQQGKVVMHAGPHGQGCHYLLFDYAHAALAQAAIADDPGTRARVLEMIRACRRADGSYLDTPILGRAYGTAMALLAMHALDEG